MLTLFTLLSRLDVRSTLPVGSTSRDG